MYKAVIFDFGGVMHSVEGISAKAGILEALKGKGDVEDARVLELYNEFLNKLGVGAVQEIEFWRGICEKLGIEVPANYKELWRVGLRDNAIPFIEMFDLVQRLKDRGIKVYVLSNTVEPHAELLREKGWYSPFHRVFLSHEMGLRKPDKRAYQHVLKEIGLKGEDVIYIDDLIENLQPAEELGMRTILAVKPQQVVVDVEKIIE